MALVASDARSEASGAGSARSSGSRKYKVVSRGSHVDESLFGSSNHKGRKSGRKVLVGEVRGFCCRTTDTYNLVVGGLCGGWSSGVEWS